MKKSLMIVIVALIVVVIGIVSVVVVSGKGERLATDLYDRLDSKESFTSVETFEGLTVTTKRDSKGNYYSKYDDTDKGYSIEKYEVDGEVVWINSFDEVRPGEATLEKEIEANLKLATIDVFADENLKSKSKDNGEFVYETNVDNLDYTVKNSDDSASFVTKASGRTFELTYSKVELITLP